MFHRSDTEQASGGNCFFCGTYLLEQDRTIDHVVSKASGGTDARWNLKWACKACNQSKGNKPVVKFRKDKGYPQRCLMVRNIYKKGNEQDCPNQGQVRLPLECALKIKAKGQSIVPGKA